MASPSPNIAGQFTPRSTAKKNYINLPQSSYTKHAILVSLWSGSFYGYNAGIISGIARSIVSCSEVHSTDIESEIANLQGIITSTILVGAMVGSLLGVPIADRFGRVRAFQICSLIGFSVFLLPFLKSFWALVIVRAIAGLPIGMLCTLCPLYVCESVSPSIRGSVGTVMQIAIAGCLCVAQFTNYFFMQDYDPNGEAPHNCIPDKNWRTQFGLGVIPAVMLFFHSFCFLPEPPQETAVADTSNQDNGNGLNDSLLPSTSLPRRTVSADNEQSNGECGTAIPITINRAPSAGSCISENSTSEDDTELSYTWKEFFTTFDGIRWALIGVGLAFSSMLTGMDALMFFGPTIIENAHVKGNINLITALVIGLWNLSCVFVATFLVDKLGRRPLMIFGLAGMTLGNFMLFIGYSYLQDVSAFMLSGVMVFIFCFELGPGALFFLMASETFPKHIRTKALPWTNCIQWIANIAVAYVFPVLEEGLGAATTFAILAVIAASSTVFCQTVLPETKDN